MPSILKFAHSDVRAAAHAGRFYPADPAELRAMIDAFLSAASTDDSAPPKAIIAPHAAYVFSGPIAASAYARLRNARGVIRRIVLIGPAHYVGFDGIAATTQSAFATPLGTAPVDQTALAQLSDLHLVIARDEAHGPEHSLEVHLPFLQVVLRDFAIVPLLVGEATDEEIAEVFEHLWDGDETRIVVSSDLSHFRDYATAKTSDRATAAAIEALRGGELDGDCACGYQPIRGLLLSAGRHGLRCRTVDLRNSGDTVGPTDRVVGYGAFVFL